MNGLPRSYIHEPPDWLWWMVVRSRRLGGLIFRMLSAMPGTCHAHVVEYIANPLDGFKLTPSRPPDACSTWRTEGAVGAESTSRSKSSRRIWRTHYTSKTRGTAWALPSSVRMRRERTPRPRAASNRGGAPLRAPPRLQAEPRLVRRPLLRVVRAESDLPRVRPRPRLGRSSRGTRRPGFPWRCKASRGQKGSPSKRSRSPRRPSFASRRSGRIGAKHASGN